MVSARRIARRAAKQAVTGSRRKTRLRAGIGPGWLRPLVSISVSPQTTAPSASSAQRVVRSSVTGTVQSFGLRPGDLVAADQSIAEILESSQLWVRVFVPETQLGLVRVDMPVRLSVDTFPKVSFRGHVASINPQGEYTPRNVQTRAQRAEQMFGLRVFLDPDARLKAGMAASVDFGVKARPE